VISHIICKFDHVHEGRCTTRLFRLAACCGILPHTAHTASSISLGMSDNPGPEYGVFMII